MTNSPISLKKLLKNSLPKEQVKALKLKNITVNGIAIDSRAVKQNDLFMAYPGHNVDGRSYINVAIASGAKAIACEASLLKSFIENAEPILADDQLLAYQLQSVIIIPVADLSKKVSRIAAKFYGAPSKRMSLIGVTGTNGKTSVCFLVAQALEMMQKPTLLLSTLGNGSVNNLEKSVNTTSDPITIQQKAAEYLQAGYHYLSMEVSSHGLHQKRVSGLKYKVAVFTNLSHDHLEYHGDMESYFAAKRELFLRKEVKYAVINADDQYGQRLLADPKITAEKIAYSRSANNITSDISNWVVSSNESFNLNGISADIKTPWGTGRLSSPLLGDFNLSNLLAVAGVLGALIGDIQKWLIALNAAKPAVGRMHKFSANEKATVVVDYAHTPDALEKALKTLRNHCEGDLWCLFGCGGDRDPSKRAAMGAIAEENSDKVIITDDNPRTESPTEIVAMIRQGMTNQTVPYIASRQEAINAAIENALQQDMVLVAGKGHEDYQEIGHQKLNYSDLKTVQNVLQVAS